MCQLLGQYFSKCTHYVGCASLCDKAAKTKADLNVCENVEVDRETAKTGIHCCQACCNESRSRLMEKYDRLVDQERKLLDPKKWNGDQEKEIAKCRSKVLAMETRLKSCPRQCLGYQKEVSGIYEGGYLGYVRAHAGGREFDVHPDRWTLKKNLIESNVEALGKWMHGTNLVDLRGDHNPAKYWPPNPEHVSPFVRRG